MRLARRLRTSLSYTGVDVNPTSVQKARDRDVQDLRGGDTVRWGVADCFGPGFLATLADLGLRQRAHLVVCNMALHYAARSGSNMEQALDNLTGALAPDGALVMSFTDAGPLIHYAMETRGQKGHMATVTLADVSPTPFGSRVHFKLNDEADGNVRVDDDEWLVHEGALRQMLGDRGLRCERWENFQVEFSEAQRQRAWRSNWLSRRATVPPAVWEVVGLYTGAIFVVGGPGAAGAQTS